MRVRTMMPLAAVWLILSTACETPAATRAGTGGSYVSQRYGYSIRVPAGWQRGSAACGTDLLVRAPDGAASIAVRIQAAGPGAPAAYQDALIAGIGAPGAVTHRAQSINGVTLQVASAVVRTAAGRPVYVRLATAVLGTARYSFVGQAADPEGAGRANVSLLVATYKTIEFTSEGQVAPPVCSQTRRSTPAPAQAHATPAPPPPAVSTPVTQGYDLPLLLTVTPKPVPAGGNATITAATAPGASCTSALAYDNIMNPLGALFGFAPQTTGPDGKTSWTWRVERVVSGGTVTVTCDLQGYTKKAAVHFTVRR